MSRKLSRAVYGYSQLLAIKRLARDIKKSSGLKHHIALNIAAMNFGFRSYKQARITPNSRFLFPGLPHTIVLDDIGDFPYRPNLRRLATT